MRGLSENLQCKKPLFLTKCWDPLELSKRKKLLDLDYIYPGGVRTGSHLFFWGKSGFLKHPITHILTDSSVSVCLCVSWRKSGFLKHPNE